MRKALHLILYIAVLALTSCGGGNRKAASDRAIGMINEAFNQKNYQRMLTLADSLGKADVISEGESYYWQGFAYYRMLQRRTSEFYWKEAIVATENSDDVDDLATYARATSYLAGLYIRYLNFSSALNIHRRTQRGREPSAGTTWRRPLAGHT